MPPSTTPNHLADVRQRRPNAEQRLTHEELERRKKPMTTYTHVRFEPRGEGVFYCYDSENDFVGIVLEGARGTLNTMRGEDDKGKGLVRSLSFEELTDIQHFMQELREEGK